MTITTIPDYLIHQINEGKGTSYHTAIKFREDDFRNFIELEYEIVKAVCSICDQQFRVSEQELIITRQYNVYDRLTVETSGSDREHIKLYFEVTQVFGKNAR